VIGHVCVNVPDLAAAKRYYDELMAMVEFEPYLAADDQFAYCPANGKPGTYLFFYPALEPGEYSRQQPGLQHLAFMVRTKAAVRAVHEWASARGAEILYEPQEFPQYPPPYYATFWLSPEGFMLEAVCHKGV
jgi:catechol 2,3-dioxygenase-like lactoylglutathione lyase family enzyme